MFLETSTHYCVNLCRTNSIADISYDFEVTNVFPLEGSFAGGSVLTVTGTGFSTTSSDNIIKVGGTPCSVTSSTSTEVICTLDSPAVTHQVDNQGVHPSKFLQIANAHPVVSVLV